MARIIQTDSLGKQRTQLTRAVAVALRQLAPQAELGDEARDLAAFIALALKAIHEGIDPSVAAWEKRGYWLKADRFRMEWAWAGQMSSRMAQAVLAGDWTTVAQVSVQTAQKLDGVQVSSSSRVGRPWQGAFQRLAENS
ncbi:MAG TPA: hypothetical protein VLL49_07470 [Anaerolineales bacterium]|nr:hypothetical protein [Anaerolineales bacterium]